ncbi:neurofilament medium polypeptide-like [Argiope bruennichi]|uniref:neurofilament medium polypeptide-like n=1 Tax=Argiope bruennichi TaxID=94029 RepID=UPI002494E790|nr:neurofilament medium polypeptide-like [Argiope bruennichi]
MAAVQLSVAVFVCVSLAGAWALPKPPISNGVSSGAGEIPDVPDYRPFGEPLGKGFPDNEVFNDYDLDSNGGGPEIFPEYDENEIHPRPPGGGVDRPLKPDDRIPEEKHPEDERKEEPEEEEDHEPPSKGGEETLDEEEEPEPEGGEEPQGPEEEDTHAVEDEKKPHDDEGEETQEGEEEVPLPFNAAIFTFKQVNHYIKQLEQAMEHVFKETLEDAAFLNNTFANTTEEEVEVDGHKYKVQKSLIKTGDEDRNSTLLVEAISSVNEDEPKKNRSERSNPDAEPIQ